MVSRGAEILPVKSPELPFATATAQALISLADSKQFRSRISADSFIS